MPLWVDATGLRHSGKARISKSYAGVLGKEQMRTRRNGIQGHGFQRYIDIDRMAVDRNGIDINQETESRGDGSLFIL